MVKKEEKFNKEITGEKSESIFIAKLNDEAKTGFAFAAQLLYHNCSEILRNNFLGKRKSSQIRDICIFFYKYWCNLAKDSKKVV